MKIWISGVTKTFLVLKSSNVDAYRLKNSPIIFLKPLGIWKIFNACNWRVQIEFDSKVF